MKKYLALNRIRQDKPNSVKVADSLYAHLFQECHDVTALAFCTPLACALADNLAPRRIPEGADQFVLLGIHLEFATGGTPLATPIIMGKAAIRAMYL